MLSRSSCARRSTTPSPPSPHRRRTEQPPRHWRRRARIRASNPRTPTRVGVPRSLLSHAPPSCSLGKPCLAEHHRRAAAAEKAGEGPGCKFFLSFKGVSASIPVYTSELLKCETKYRKIGKMQTQLIWIPCNKIYKFCNIHICRNSTKFNLGKRLRKPPYACSWSSAHQMTLIFGYVITNGMLRSQ